MLAEQAKCIDTNGDEMCGILIDHKYFICACCGGVFEVDEITDLEIWSTWVDFTDTISD